MTFRYYPLIYIKCITPVCLTILAASLAFSVPSFASPKAATSSTYDVYLESKKTGDKPTATMQYLPQTKPGEISTQTTAYGDCGTTSLYDTPNGLRWSIEPIKKATPYAYDGYIDIYDDATDKLVKSYPVTGATTGDTSGYVTRYGTSGKYYTAIFGGFVTFTDGGKCSISNPYTTYKK